MIGQMAATAAAMDTVRDLRAEVERYSEASHLLRSLVLAAYQEGFNDGGDIAEGLAAAPEWERTRAGRELARIDALMTIAREDGEPSGPNAA
jgi:hypothetical protein